MPKPIPPATLDWVFPPNKSFEYFENGSRHPFLHQAANFELVNAWWLAEAALLSYAEPGFAIPVFESAGFRVEGAQPLNGSSTQCYVVDTDDFIIVTFRGTQVYKPGIGGSMHDIVRAIVADLAVDAKLTLVKFDQFGYVHAGFKDALDEIWESSLKPLLDRLKARRPHSTVWFTGHSLGASLAALAAARYQDVQGLYIFGSPMIGDIEFKNNFPIKPNYRIVNNNDIIPFLPPAARYRPFRFFSGLYHHIGELKYIDSAGQMITDPTLSQRVIDGVRGSVGHFFESIRRFRRDWVLELPVDSVNDHGPVFYAINVWNCYERTLTIQPALET